MADTSSLAEPQLNATPLIDVLLVLLVMLIFTLPIATHAVKLNLPQGPHGPPPPAIQLEIASTGDVYWNQEHVESLAALVPRFARLAGMADPPLLKVGAEKRAPYEKVAQVLAAAQRARVQKMTVMPVAEQ